MNTLVSNEGLVIRFGHEGMERSRKRAYSLLDFAKYKMCPLPLNSQRQFFAVPQMQVCHQSQNYFYATQHDTTFEDDYCDMSCYTPFQSILHIKFKISYQIAVIVDKLQDLAELEQQG